MRSSGFRAFRSSTCRAGRSGTSAGSRSSGAAAIAPTTRRRRARRRGCPMPMRGGTRAGCPTRRAGRCRCPTGTASTRISTRRWPTRSTALAGTRDGERYFFELALYHEDMHGEALLMTLQTLGLPLPPAYPRAGVVASGLATADGDVAFAGGNVRTGKPARRRRAPLHVRQREMGAPGRARAVRARAPVRDQRRVRGVRRRGRLLAARVLDRGRDGDGARSPTARTRRTGGARTGAGSSAASTHGARSTPRSP